MKRIICILGIILLCIGFSACSDDANGEPSSDVATPDQQETEAPAKPYASLEEYLEAPEVQAEINDAIDSSGDSMTMAVYVDGDTLVYEYTFTQTYDEEQTETLKSKLDAGLEENASTYEEYVSLLKADVDVENPKIKVVYRNGDGTVITERIYE